MSDIGPLRQQQIVPPAKPLRILLLVVAAIAIYIFGAGWFTPKERIPWREDFAGAQKEARQTGKPLFLYFTAQWCGPCQSLKGTVWADRNVAAEMDRYVPVKLDIDIPANKSLAIEYGASQGIPYFVVLDKQGTIVRSGVGAVPAEKFLRWLKGEGELTS